MSLVLILLQLRDGCSITQGVLCTENFFVGICRLILPRPTSTRMFVPARIKEDIKAVEKLVDLLEDVLTNPWKRRSVHEFVHWSRAEESRQRMTLW